MASALSREMEMMEVQLNRWKDIAHEALSLREETQSLKASLAGKVYYNRDTYNMAMFYIVYCCYELYSMFL